MPLPLHSPFSILHSTFSILLTVPAASAIVHAGCGNSSAVERNLAKVDVEGSIPFSRSKSNANQGPERGPFFFLITLRARVDRSRIRTRKQMESAES